MTTKGSLAALPSLKPIDRADGGRQQHEFAQPIDDELIRYSGLTIKSVGGPGEMMGQQSGLQERLSMNFDSMTGFHLIIY